MGRNITYKITENDCWECTSHKPMPSGYVQMRFNGGQIRLHRYMYIQKFGDIKEGYVIRHKCDNPICINPDHLIEGTYSDNSQDRVDKGRSTKGTKQSAPKLNAKQALEIFNSNNTQAELASKYGVSTVTIGNIKTGKTWSHITDKINY